MSEPAEKHSTVPYRYRATLERRRPVPKADGKKHHVDVRAAVAGQVFPEPYDHAIAVALAQRELQPLLDDGWRIRSLVVTIYDEKDA